MPVPPIHLPLLVPVNQQLIAQHTYNNPPVVHANLDVDVQSPDMDDDGKYPYRKHVTARLSLTGPVLQQFRGVVLGGPVRANRDQLVLWCHAECSSCVSSPRSRCSPTGWYLDPLYDRNHNQGFTLDWSSSTFAGIATFIINHRPRRPKGQDQPRRCASEALTLTFFFRDWIGHALAEKKVGPFQARVHKKKVRADATVLPVEQIAPVGQIAPVYVQAPVPCPCFNCMYRAMQHQPNG